MHPELTAGIEGLYQAFAGYPAPRWVHACACCHEPEDGREPPEPPPGRTRPIEPVRLRAPGTGTALADISAEDLDWYAAEAPILVGEEPDWKHYLPRLLEIAMRHPTLDWPDREYVIGQLARGNPTPWFEWPQHEADAIRRALHGYWLNELNSTLDDEDGDRVDTTICSIAAADPDIDWYLNDWESFQGSHSARSLDGFLRMNAGRLAKHRLDNPYWDRQSEPSRSNHDQIIEWLKSDRLIEAVIDASERPQSHEEAVALAASFDLLGSIRSL